MSSGHLRVSSLGAAGNEEEIVSSVSPGPTSPWGLPCACALGTKEGREDLWVFSRWTGSPGAPGKWRGLKAHSCYSSCAHQPAR